MNVELAQCCKDTFKFLIAKFFGSPNFTDKFTLVLFLSNGYKNFDRIAYFSLFQIL